MDTFELLPSLAQGELADTSAPELVAAVFRSRASGTLWLETKDTAEFRIYFRAGEMSGTAAFSGFKTLAHVLLENEWVGALDIDASRSEAEATKKRHGEVLVARGLLTIEQLRNALAEQHRANLRNLFTAVKGPYDWRGWEPPPAWAREVVIDPVGAIVDALEQDLHAHRRQRVLSWLGAHPARLSVDWPDLQGRILIGAMDRRAAALLALPRTLVEFVQASRLPPTRAEALLVALLLSGGVEPQPVAAQAAPVHAAAALEVLEPEALEPFPEAMPEPEPRSEAEVLMPEPEALPEPEGLDARALPSPDGDALPALEESPAALQAAVTEIEALARLDSLTLDEGSEPEAPLELDVRQKPAPARSPASPPPLVARDELELDLRSDTPLETAPARAPGDPRNDVLRKRMVQQGMRNLGGRPAPEAREEVAFTDSLKTAVAPAELDVARLSDEDRRFVAEVRGRAKAMEGQTAYARLGVTAATAGDGIKQAYLTSAKRYHPDRSSAPGLAALQPELQRVFAALKEAYDLVATAEARTRYDAQLKASGGVPTKGSARRDEANLAVKMGDVLLKKRDFEGALNKLRRAVDLDASGDTLAALAWGLVSDPKQPAATKEEAASLINRALRAPGVTARTYYVAGVLWRTKDPESAVDAFRKALELDPHHPDAALELRLIEQRRGKQAKGGGVLSGLLFGKRKP